MSSTHGSEAITEGVRVRAEPIYLPEESDPDHPNPRQRRFTFSYRITISNESEAGVRLLTRRWDVVNSHGELHVIEGEGVIGEQPYLSPGESFEYTSWCPLETSWGTMEGHYMMRIDGGKPLQVRIARFYLVSNPEPAPTVDHAASRSPLASS